MHDKLQIVILADNDSLPLLHNGLAREPTVSVVFADSQPQKILSFLNTHKKHASPLIVLSDHRTPVADLDFITAVKETGTPLIVIASSANEGFYLLENGATGMVVRHLDRTTGSESYFYRMLATQIKAEMTKLQEGRKRENIINSDLPVGKIVAIGSSTGGTETVLEILKQMPADSPPILVAQHMPPVFTKMYAERANDLCNVDVWEARNGDKVENGLVLVAPGDHHMTLVKKDNEYFVACQKGEKVNAQCPSVDVLFMSVAREAGSEAVGVILTGMGADGASGLLAMRKQGAYTIGQDKETSIVYGMPRAAFEMGAVTIQLPYPKIPQEILNHI